MDNRADVARFLTALRGRLTPEAAGLIVFGGERRVPGLRREEVAQLAGVSTAYYTRMERGDLSGVSDSVLYAIVRALQLSEAETAHLFDLARNASGSRPRSRRKADVRVPERLTLVLDRMRDIPALVMTQLGDPVGSNALGRALFPHLFPPGGPALNHSRYVFLDPRSRTFYPDWELSAREAVSALRLIAGRDPADQALTALVGELSTHSPEFRRWWSGHSVRMHLSGTKRIDHPQVGEVTIGYDVLAVASAPGLVMTTYLPEPGSASADALELLGSLIADGATAVDSSQAGSGRP